jgi:hypothetical protein
LEDAGVGIFAAIAADKVPLDSIQVEFDAQINRMKTELISSIMLRFMHVVKAKRSWGLF